VRHPGLVDLGQDPVEAVQALLDDDVEAVVVHERVVHVRDVGVPHADQVGHLGFPLPLHVLEGAGGLEHLGDERVRPLVGALVDVSIGARTDVLPDEVRTAASVGDHLTTNGSSERKDAGKRLDGGMRLHPARTIPRRCTVRSFRRRMRVLPHDWR